MTEFVVSFEDVELNDEQKARVKEAIQEGASKGLQSVSPDSLPIAREPGQTSPPHNPGGRGTPGHPGNQGNQGKPSKPGQGINYPPKPIGKGPLPIVFPVSYRPESKSWTRE